MVGIEEKAPGFALGTIGDLVGLARKASMWPVTMGLACCAIEMMATGGARFDISRFGMEVFRASPRHADLMIVSGRLSQKMSPVVRHRWPTGFAQFQGWLSPHSQMERTIGRPAARRASRIVVYAPDALSESVSHQSYLR